MNDGGVQCVVESKKDKMRFRIQGTGKEERQWTMERGWRRTIQDAGYRMKMMYMGRVP